MASTASGTSALGERAGLASGLLNAAAQLGPALGLAIVGVAASWVLAAGYVLAAALALSAGLVVGAGELQQVREWYPITLDR